MAATLDVRHCKPSCNQVQATSTVRLNCPLFLFLCRFLFSSKKFAPGCPRSDNSHLARPIASPVLLVGLARSAADGPAHHHRGTRRSSSSSDFYCADLLLLNARRIQAFLQQQDFLIALDAPELLLRFQEPRGGPAQRLISFTPTFYVPSHPLHRRQARFDRVGGGEFPTQHRSDTQAMHRQRFFQPFLKTPGSARINPFQLPEDFLQRGFGVRVVVHRVGIEHPPVVVLLAVFRQVLHHIPPLMKLATLHFYLFTENTFHTGSQRFRSIHHHQIPPLQIQSSVH